MSETAPELSSAPGSCAVCGCAIPDRCFCKIYRQATGPILLCQPACTLRYIDSARPPGDDLDQELRAYEQSVHFLIKQTHS